MDTKENASSIETPGQQFPRRRLLNRPRSKTFHSLPSSRRTPTKSILKEERSSEIENVSQSRRIRPVSCVTIESKRRPRSATPFLWRPKTVSEAKTQNSGLSGKDLFFVLGCGVSFENNSRQNRDEKRDFYSGFSGRRRRTSSASNTRSRNQSSGSIENLSARSRSGSKSTLSRVPGLIKLSGCMNMKDFIEAEHDDDEEQRRKQLKEKFRHAIRLVRIFSSFCIGIKRYAEQDKGGQYDMYYLRDMLPGNEDKPTPVQEASLYFNKHLFSRENTLHFPLWARWTCALAPSDRSDAEINKLVTLLRGMKSFNKFSREAQWHLCRTMTYARYEKRRIIVRQGHPGYCFYFIASGTVSVTVTRRDLKTGIYVTNTVDVLEKNDAFGEIALITEDACRTATVICRERVEVLVVNRETVMEHCPDVFQNEFQEKFNILKTHNLFRRWDEKSLKQLCFDSP